MAVFSSVRRSFTPQGVASTRSGSAVAEPCSQSPKMSTCEALAAVALANSKARSTEAISDARFCWIASNAPALMSASTVRLLMRWRSMRTQKSNRLVNGPPSSRALTIASTASWPVPLTAPSP